MTNKTDAPGRVLLTFRQAAERCGLSERRLRWFRFTDTASFNAACVLKLGRSVFIDSRKLDAWIDSLGPAGRQGAR